MKDDFRVARETAADSVIWRAADNAITSVSAAWRHSVLRTFALGMTGSLASWNIDERVRSAASAIAIAGVVNIALLWRSSPYASPGIPRAAIAVAAAGATVVAIWPGPFTNAWSSSVLGRISALVRRLVYKPAE
jgi:hypothetical protein